MIVRVSGNDSERVRQSWFGDDRISSLILVQGFEPDAAALREILATYPDARCDTRVSQRRSLISNRAVRRRDIPCASARRSSSGECCERGAFRMSDWFYEGRAAYREYPTR